MPPTGPKTAYVRDEHNRPIIGLRIQKAKDRLGKPIERYFALDDQGKRIYFGRSTDKPAAIFKFRQWEQRRTGKQVRLGYTRTGSVTFMDGSTESTKSTDPRPIDMDAFYAKARELILSDPRAFADKVRIPQIGYLEDLEPPAPSLSLSQIGEMYRNKRKKLSESWKRKVKLFWDEFVAIVHVETVRDVTADHIDAYYNAVYDHHSERGQSPTYVGHRFQCVKSVLRHAMTKGKDQAQLRRVLDLCAMLVPPEKRGTDPHPIAPKDFLKLLSKSDAKWKAVFLLSLNAALYPSEVAAVRKSHVDLRDRTLVMDRGKTGVPRIAVLWRRTVDAIRAYQAEHPHHSKYLFVSATGAPYNANHMGRNFRKRRADAHLPETVEFAHIRDGAYTAAVEGGADVNDAKMLAGHRVGIADHYLKRNPKMVADACKTIEKAYFGT